MLATKFHLIPTNSLDLESGGYSQLPGGARAEAERRRYGNAHLIYVMVTDITRPIVQWR
jgi:hypothetical protein